VIYPRRICPQWWLPSERLLLMSGWHSLEGTWSLANYWVSRRVTGYDDDNSSDDNNMRRMVG